MAGTLNYHKASPYTVELGSLVMNGFDLGLLSYPIFDENYREQLNNKIIEHYWFREIGQETPQLFKMFLNRTMNEIMPYYNEMYKTTLLDVNPLANVDVATQGTRDSGHEEMRDTKRADSYTGKRTESGTSTTDSDTESDARTVNSTTPQMQLSGREDYASSLVDANSTANTTGTTNTTGQSADTSYTDVTELANMNANDTQQYVERITGLQGLTGAQAVQLAREAILNVDMMVIYALEPLFMQVWYTGMNLY